ncbi:MAG: hypothetical protein ACRDPG_07240 [Nocardioidaceae bacterium]
MNGDRRLRQSSEAAGWAKTFGRGYARRAALGVGSLVTTMLVVAGGGAAFAQHAPAATATVVGSVRPTTHDNLLRPGYRVSAHRADGNCWTTSVVQNSAYRCMSHNLILDPCWRLGAGRSHVACLEAPWQHQVVVLKLTHRLAAPATPQRWLWGLRLHGGADCQGFQGAGSIFHHHLVRFYCTHRLGILGYPDKSASVWTAHVVRFAHGQWHDAGSQPITDAWYAERSPQ